VRPSIERSTNGAWSKIGVRAASPPRAAASAGSRSFTAFEMPTALASGFAVTAMPRLGVPSVRVMDVISPGCDSTDATSPRRTGGPPRVGVR
jgi:hypothetical protein